MNNSTITIPLSKTGKKKGKYEAIVDAIDSDLAQYNWSVMQHRYAHREVFIDGKRKKVRLHRVIMERKLGYPIPDDFDIDHIDGDGFNNTRGNLRLATVFQNLANQDKQKRNKSGYKGVYWHKKAQKWAAQISAHYKHYYLGLFDTAELAHEAYCEKAKELHGEFANTGE